MAFPKTWKTLLSKLWEYLKYAKSKYRNGSSIFESSILYWSSWVWPSMTKCHLHFTNGRYKSFDSIQKVLQWFKLERILCFKRTSYRDITWCTNTISIFTTKQTWLKNRKFKNVICFLYFIVVKETIFYVTKIEKNWRGVSPSGLCDE